MSQQDSLFHEPAAGAPQSAGTAGTTTPFSAPPSHEDRLTAELKAARRQIVNLFILLLALSGTFSIYLLQQVRHERAALNALVAQEAQLAQARQIIANYNTQSAPAIKDFMNRLAEYAKTDPDVLPVLGKYGLVSRRPAPAGSAPEPAQNP